MGKQVAFSVCFLLCLVLLLARLEETQPHSHNLSLGSGTEVGAKGEVLGTSLQETQILPWPPMTSPCGHGSPIHLHYEIQATIRSLLLGNRLLATIQKSWEAHALETHVTPASFDLPCTHASPHAVRSRHNLSYSIHLRLRASCARRHFVTNTQFIKEEKLHRLNSPA